MALGPEQAVSEAIAARHFADLAPRLDALDLQTSNPADLDQWPHTLQLLGHIYNGNLEDARFVWKRASDTHKQNPQLQAAFALLKQLWNKNYEGVWPVLRSAPWDANSSPLAHAIADKQQESALQLVSHAYSSIQPARLAALTGVSPQDALQMAQSQGWQLNGDVILVQRKTTDNGTQATSDHLQNLTEFVVQLET